LMCGPGSHFAPGVVNKPIRMSITNSYNESAALPRRVSLNYLLCRRGLQTPGIPRRLAVQVLLTTRGR
jgi:hypothetical protein